MYSLLKILLIDLPDVVYIGMWSDGVFLFHQKGTFQVSVVDKVMV